MSLCASVVCPLRSRVRRLRAPTFHDVVAALAPLPPDGDWVQLLLRLAVRVSVTVFAFGTARRVLDTRRP